MDKRFVSIILSIVLVGVPLLVSAESSSTNFIMWGQAFTNGGNLSTSTNYRGFNSLGDLSNDELASTNYQSVQGFQAIYEEPVITFSLSLNSLTLSPDPVTTGGVSSASTVATVSTNADFGYVLTVTETDIFDNQGGTAWTDVADGTVTAGSDEFGISVTGDDAAFGDDQAVTASPLTLASNTIWGADRTTTATFEAAASAVTEAGTYSGTFTFIATGQF